VRLRFEKMHGAGNDFLLVDGRQLAGARLDAPMIARLCRRHTGVGADGLIILLPDAELDFQMEYYNADGHPADMCGNGARCAVAFALKTGLGEEACRFRTSKGTVHGEMAGLEIAVELPPWRDERLHLPVAGSPFADHHLVDTGVPHLVVPVADVAEVDVARWGPYLRGHAVLGPAGANVDWVESAARPDQSVARSGGSPGIGPGADGSEGGGRMVFRLRTYERGVEAETLACGTGASAAAVVLCRLGLAASPVALLTRGGDVLTVTVTVEEGRSALRLRGPVVSVYSGEVQINE
jgi:diaminopimelate epimerase